MSDALHQSLDRVLSLLIAILPGILAFFVAMAVFTLVGMALSALLRRGLAWARFDDVLPRPRQSRLDAGNFAFRAHRRASFWASVILGLIIGASAFDASTRLPPRFPSPCCLPDQGCRRHLPPYRGTLIARFLARSVLIGAVNAQLQYARFLSLGVKWLVLVLTAAMVLDHLEVAALLLSWPLASSSAALFLPSLSPLVSALAISSAVRSKATSIAPSMASVSHAAPASPAESLRHF